MYRFSLDAEDPAYDALAVVLLPSKLLELIAPCVEHVPGFSDCAFIHLSHPMNPRHFLPVFISRAIFSKRLVTAVTEMIGGMTITAQI